MPYFGGDRYFRTIIAYYAFLAFNFLVLYPKFKENV